MGGDPRLYGIVPQDSKLKIKGPNELGQMNVPGILRKNLILTLSIHWHTSCSLLPCSSVFCKYLQVYNALNTSEMYITMSLSLAKSPEEEISGQCDKRAPPCCGCVA